MTNFRRYFSIPILLLLMVGSIFILRYGGTTVAQVKPLTFPDLYTALNTKVPNKAFKTRADLIIWVIGEVKKRRVDKPLTRDREEDLLQAGATSDLIEAIRLNSPSATNSNSAEGATTLLIPTPLKMLSPIEMEFVKIPSGNFVMGSNRPDTDESPAHKVNISKEFWLQKTEVTQGQWQEIMGGLPASAECDLARATEKFLGNNKPMICVSWKDTQEFIEKLNLRDINYKYRLPTEAEWEYAARAGTKGEIPKNLEKTSWLNVGTTADYPHDVASKQANAWKLFDMQGNVFEWLSDWYDPKFYTKSPSKDPAGPEYPVGGNFKVKRGGSWKSDEPSVHLSVRGREDQSLRQLDTGFRLIREKK